MTLAVVSPVQSVTKNGTEYLKLRLLSDGRVKVERTKAGRTLNGFWTVWLQDLILHSNAAAKYGIAVELQDSCIIVSSSASHEGLRETVRAFAQQIVPLNPPIRRERTDHMFAYWRVKEGVYLSNLLPNVRMPEGAEVIGGNRQILCLFRKQKAVLPMRDLARILEYQLALAYSSESAS